MAGITCDRRPSGTDLIIYALVDSLVLHSGYSNIRLESYLFTTQAFEDIKKRLRPGGVFVMYNYFRQGWIVDRLQAMLEQTFGPATPSSSTCRRARRSLQTMCWPTTFTVMFAGGTEPIKAAFAARPGTGCPRTAAAMPARRTVSDVRPGGPRGVVGHLGGDRPREVGEVRAHEGDPAGDASCGSRPTRGRSLYLRGPMIPALNLRGMALMGVLGALFLVPFLRGRTDDTASSGARGVGFLAQMFFLGAGFMLVETKAVVQMALLFGGTWMVNSIVFCAVLTMILLANLLVLAVRPQSLVPYYVGLALSLAASAIVPLDAFLGLSRGLQIAGSCALAFTPILFAGVIFAMSFRHAADADKAFGANVAGAMVGGLSEVQLDAPRLPVCRARRARLLRPLRDRLVTEIVPAVGVARTGPHCQHLAGAIDRGASKTRVAT